MKILVAGGAGYIGSSLVPVLLRAGHEVTVIDLLWFGNYLKYEPQYDKVLTVIQKNLFDCKEKELLGFDQFIFLAGVSNDPMAEYNPSLNFIYNSALPSYLAYIAKKAGIKRFIYASSCSVYGFTDNKSLTEEDPTNSKAPYGISKLQGEKGVMQLADDDFSVIALRQGTVVGWSNRMRMDLVINGMTKDAIVNKQINVDNSTIWRPIFDIRDCVHAYLCAINAKEKLSGVFNVSSKNYQLLELAERVKEEVENFYNNIPGDKDKLSVTLNVKSTIIDTYRNYKVDTTKAEEVLGFSPQYKNVYDTVENILQNMSLFCWHVTSPYWNERDDYYNIRIFKKLNL
jgi:nucleoside-diphosphate-sugar epimerase